MKLILLLVPLLAMAQTPQVSPFAPPSGTSNPATCYPSQLFFNTTVPAFEGCTAANVWTQFSGGGGGSVSSVGLAAISGLTSVSGSPIIGSGTLTQSLVNQSANMVFAGPGSGGSSTPGFRALVAADLPAVPGSSISNPLVLIGGSGATGRIQLTGDFTAASNGGIVPASGASAHLITMTTPTPRGTNVYNGLKITSNEAGSNSISLSVNSPMSSTIAPPSSSWTVSDPIYDGYLFDLGGYPAAARQANAPIESLVGSVDIPGSATKFQGTGGAFYARSASPTTVAVALYGQAGTNANNVETWSLNTVVQNCDNIQGAGHCNGDGSGNSGTTLIGYEVDINNYQSSTNGVSGIILLGAGTRQATNGFDAIVVAPPGSTMYTPFQKSLGTLNNVVISGGSGTVNCTAANCSANALTGNTMIIYGSSTAAIWGQYTITGKPTSTSFTFSSGSAPNGTYNDTGLIVIINAVPWKNAFNVLPGSATVGLNLQEATGQGFAPANSAAINLTANDGTTRLQSQIYATQLGLQMTTPVGHNFSVTDSTGTPIFGATTSTFTAAGGLSGHASCWNGARISYCTSAVAGDGSCTCH